MNAIVRTGMLATGLAVAMAGVGYASVPLYRLFCQVTGFGGTTQKAIGQSAPGAVAGRTMSVRFDANHSSSLPWTFQQEVNREVVKVGEQEIAFFVAKNLSDKPVTGTATFNVTPNQAGKYFTKIQCFCFTKQTLQPGQEVRMPVIYYVDPSILQDDEAKAVKQITLSYVFHQDIASGEKLGAKGLDRAATAR
ncbi:MAG: cytochrome c oxidase assembly protein [Betaproteobacteria bacterium]|nr:cytochrome c oxidase assembly protein [Betaproteobacteria bacterium]